MVEPATLTASVIATLAFQKFVEAGAGELAKKFTAEALGKMDELRQKLWAKLRGHSPRLDQALHQAEQGDQEALQTIAKNLEVAMDEDETFKREVNLLAKEIQVGEINDSNQTQNIYSGGVGFQSQAKDKATVNQAQTLNQYFHP